MSAGSAFQIDDKGHLATNYHVIAEAVGNPGRYKVKYIADDEKEGYAEIKGINIIHDLAIVKHDSEQDFHLSIREQ